MSLIMFIAKASLLVALATPPTMLEQVVQLPVIHQGTLWIGVSNVPAIVHYDEATKTVYVVVVKKGRWGLEPLFIYKVPLDTLVPELVWSAQETEA